MNGKIGAMITIFMMVSMAVGFNGWDDSKSYADNVKNIFSTNVINFSDGPHSPELNWSDGDKPIHSVDGTPFGFNNAQAVIDEKNNKFMGRESDPYAENVSRPTKPVRTLDGSFGGPTTDQGAVDQKIANFLAN